LFRKFQRNEYNADYTKGQINALRRRQMIFIRKFFRLNCKGPHYRKDVLPLILAAEEDRKNEDNHFYFNGEELKVIGVLKETYARIENLRRRYEKTVISGAGNSEHDIRGTEFLTRGIDIFTFFEWSRHVQQDDSARPEQEFEEKDTEAELAKKASEFRKEVKDMIAA
jgi:hypothetical protein